VQKKGSRDEKNIYKRFFIKKSQMGKIGLMLWGTFNKALHCKINVSHEKALIAIRIYDLEKNYKYKNFERWACAMDKWTLL
jgi:hypothetical protein